MGGDGQQAPKSMRWQEFGGVHRFAQLSDFKVQIHLIRVGAAHFSDLLTFFDRLIFLDEQGLVVSVGAQVGVVVLEDDQVAVATKAIAGIDHLTVCGRLHSVSRLAPDVQAFEGFVFIKIINDRAVGWPSKAQFIATLAGLGGR